MIYGLRPQGRGEGQWQYRPQHLVQTVQTTSDKFLEHTYHSWGKAEDNGTSGDTTCWTVDEEMRAAGQGWILCVLSHVQVMVTPQTVAHEAPLSVDFPGKNTRLCCHFLTQGIFPTQGLKPLLHGQVGFFLHWGPGEAQGWIVLQLIFTERTRSTFWIWWLGFVCFGAEEWDDLLMCF